MRASPGGEPVRFRFPRQSDGQAPLHRRLLPSTTAERRIRHRGLHARDRWGRRLASTRRNFPSRTSTSDYLHFHGFAVETAEALAEMWHRRVRQELGIAGKDGETIKELFSQGYQGSRYCFGYPACPDLEEQVGIATLLKPERIGVRAERDVPVAPGTDNQRDRGAPPGGALLRGEVGAADPGESALDCRRSGGGDCRDGGRLHDEEHDRGDAHRPWRRRGDRRVPDDATEAEDREEAEAVGMPPTLDEVRKQFELFAEVEMWRRGAALYRRRSAVARAGDDWPLALANEGREAVRRANLLLATPVHAVDRPRIRTAGSQGSPPGHGAPAPIESFATSQGRALPT